MMLNLLKRKIMNIVQEIEQRYRNNPKHGIWFSIDASAYESKVGDRVSFGDNTTDMQGGKLYNWQDIILDGKVVGYIEEVESGRLFDPIKSSFIVPLAYCTEHELWNEMNVKYKDNPHLYDLEEILQLRFATLNQLLEHLTPTNINIKHQKNERQGNQKKVARGFRY